MAEKLSDYKFKTDIIIRFADMDAAGHVNNAKYLTYFEEARFSYWGTVTGWNMKDTGIVVGRSEINYLKPLTVGDRIVCYVRVTRIGNSSFDVMHVLVKLTDKGEEICTTCKTVCISYDYTTNKSISIPKEGRKKMIEYDEPGLILNTN
jgi:acyl-CoA thioester hydrolase